MKTVDKILHTIKREGALTAKQLAAKFEMTAMGARLHLQSLESDGLLHSYDVKVKVGRPTRHWALTDAGHNYFADRHSELTVQIIEAVEHIYGSEGIHQIAQRRGITMLEHYQQVLAQHNSLEEKLRELVRLRDQEGHMAELEKTEKGFTLTENHCPICKAALQCPSFCESELNVFNTLLGDLCKIERQEHIIEGHRRCAYSILPV
ncbi:hypothetical protein VA7868_00052 [Vibrio aerogenes CECT 7868]|uniref:Uncharacterized protein n=1 Tax=Vibrio aerogenes CECT 7868 TaxID=1216006 RepID=A0A1M5UAV5_9VIBR|nr:metalloregulator ArsR/SmtB family transcription factor [Vibrio aerogenes]SHH60152.1 hypothetical protein VA7868_00052 [Vibrio aerogenes CECT 7868]